MAIDWFYGKTKRPPEVKEKKAHALLQANRLDEAARLFSQLSRSAPGDIEILLGMGFIEGEKGNHAAAVQYLDRAVSIRPGFYQAWYNLRVALSTPTGVCGGNGYVEYIPWRCI